MCLLRRPLDKTEETFARPLNTDNQYRHSTASNRKSWIRGEPGKISLRENRPGRRHKLSAQTAKGVREKK